jgi:hypothetical protein
MAVSPNVCGAASVSSDLKIASKQRPVAQADPRPSPDATEDEVHEVLAICEGDAVAGLRITLIANAFLKAEIDRLSCRSVMRLCAWQS